MANVAAPIELLKNVPLFARVDDRGLKLLAGTFTERSFKEGAQLTTEGQGAAGFFVIESGAALVTVDGEERRSLGPGDYYGEIALVGLARDADLFLCEATLLQPNPEGGIRGHLAADEADAAFRASGADRLLLTHRPAERPLDERFEQAHDGLELEL